MSKHLITIAATPHGVLAAKHDGADQQYCESGETVTLDWQPDDKWGLQECHYTDENNNVVDIDLTTKTFTMPAAAIEIGGTFKRFVLQDWATKQGTANERPTLTAADAGYLYFDTTLKKWIVWNGAYWTDMAGRPTEPRYLKFTAEQDGCNVGAIVFNDGGYDLSGYPDYVAPSLEYSTDGGVTWQEYNLQVSDDTANATMIALDEGESVLFRGKNDNLAYYLENDDDWLRVQFYIDGNVAASGDVTALLNAWGGDVELAEYCYYFMFYGCTGLTSAPKLPATTLASYCYSNMFQNCTGLTQAPELPATTLADYCYGSMFYGCTGLTSAPELPATTLAYYCYSSMFRGCTGLTSAPKLPATTLASDCYRYMFRDCSNLAYIKAMFLTTPSSSYTSNWVNGVAASGTFVKNSAATWNVTGNNGVPSGWTVETANA